MTERRVKLLRVGRTQVLRIPRGFELPGEAAVIREEGDRLEHPRPDDVLL